jgi:hypothetical protein
MILNCLIDISNLLVVVNSATNFLVYFRWRNVLRYNTSSSQNSTQKQVRLLTYSNNQLSVWNMVLRTSEVTHVHFYRASDKSFDLIVRHINYGECQERIN